MNAAAALRDAVRDLALLLRDDLSELRLTGGRAPRCAMTALAVTLAVLVALAVRVDAVWWAAISALVSTQASGPASLRRGAMRIAGTATGAIVGLVLSVWVIDDPVGLSLALLTVSSVGVMGLLVSRHGYAWLLGAVTVDMVLLAALDDPFSALSTAANRTAEVAIGTSAAILVALVLAPDDQPQPQAAPGWSDLLGARWPAVEHALRAGLGVMLVPLVWSWLQLPSLSQTAITAAAVMAVPSLSDDAGTDRRKIVGRAMHRIVGCLLGGGAGLACLALSVDTFLPWLAMLAIGVWIGAHVQASPRGIGYVGTQGGVVFICTLVQGWGPPTDILPGIERLAGIAGGLLILLAVSLLTAPDRLPPLSLAEGGGLPDHAASTREIRRP